MIRILHIGMTSNYGGLENFIMNIYRNIDRNKFQFDFLAMKDEEIAYETEIRSLGGRVFHVLYPRKNYRRYTMPLFSFFKKNSYQIIHNHRTHIGDLDYLWMAYVADVPIRIIHSHSTGYIFPLNRLAKVAEEINGRYLNKVSTNLFACSIEAGNWMFKNQQFEIIRNAIDLQKFSYNFNNRERLRKEFDFNKNDIILGHIGTFFDVKNHIFLVDLLTELVKENKKFKLVLVGEGPLKESIKQEVKARNLLDFVYFLGKRNDVDELYNLMDIFLLPSKFEGLPLVAVEAQANGLPIILSNNVTDEVVIGSNIKKISLDNLNDWKEYIITNNLKRVDNTKLLVKQGYEIKSMTKQLEHEYIRIYKQRIRN